eukprot:1160802-Pelagomonas_calceolata.AAC.5
MRFFTIYPRHASKSKGPEDWPGWPAKSWHALAQDPSKRLGSWNVNGMELQGLSVRQSDLLGFAPLC